MGYALKGSTLHGTLNIKSNHMNVNDFMSADTTATTVADTTGTAQPTEAGSLLIIPKNIDFTMQANLKEVLFDSMTFKDVNGKLTVRGGKVDMQNCHSEQWEAMSCSMAATRQQTRRHPPSMQA